ncbi:MAG: phosphoribosylformylglycinamidine cyclo-ligase [Opitutia bacterium]|nr:phosphoribosylformylglycinamidine cyclo-ligase [Opitutales bacterium]PHX80204.1 MAG: phosphoribosylformylglycinamidine cyclo-ligase [Opitutae bacterium]
MAHESKPSADSSRYAARGVSASKGEVHAAVDRLDPGLYPQAFCKIVADGLTGDASKCVVTHSDGSGTKALLAYLWWKETGDAAVFRGIAQDSIVMNIDDLLCVGVTKGVILSSTINRNAKAIPGAILAELINGTEDVLAMLRAQGFGITSGGGETADVGDLTPTLTVDSTATAILNRAEVVDAARVVPGLVIVGIASYGRATYEPVENSGIGSNGLTSARHELLSQYYAEKYPETYDKATPAELAYCGPHRLADALPGSALSVGQALLSPTRTYAPYVLRLLQALGNERVKGLVHCSGGGQTKCRRFGSKVHFIKDNLFPTPPIFAEIAQVSGTEAKEMHQVYNMGHRLEVFLEPQDVEVALRLAAELGLGAQVIGRTEASARPDTANHVTIIRAGQVLEYS